MNVRSLFMGVVVLATVGLPAQAEPVAGHESQPWQLSQKFPINDEDPEMSVPSKDQRLRNPMEFGYLLQDLIEGAEVARKRGDYYGVVRYYRAIVKGVPERAKGWSKLCEAYATVNDHEQASKACGTALSLPGVELQDYTRFVQETLLLPGKPTAANVTKLKDVLDHLDRQPGVELAASDLRCQVGVAAGDSRMLETCTAALTRLDPNNPKTVVYQWTLAMQRGQIEAAGRLVERAKALKVPSSNIERMQALTDSGHHGYLWKGVVVAFFLLAAGGALTLARRRRTQLALAVR